MVLLSLDQSSHTSGYAIFQDDKLLAYGKFTFNDQDIGKRLCKIRAQIKEFIEKYSPNHVIFEEIQQQGNVTNNIQTFKTLAMVQGVIMQLLTELNISYSSVYATSWKSVTGIKGKTRAEQKKASQNYVLDKYNYKVIEDIADAICIGDYYIKNDQKGKCAWAE